MSDPADERPYSFERRGGWRGGEAAARARATFLQRLGVTEAKLGDGDVDRLLRRYVVELHLNIEWYDAKLSRERAYHRAFLALTVGLLVIAIPVLAWVPSLALLDELDGTSSVAHVTGILTGLLALHRSFGETLDRRKRVALFHDAAADLKEMLYSLEDRFRGRVLLDGAPDPLFLQALDDGIRGARAIVRAERKKHFQDLQSAPSLDIGGALQRAATQASAALRPPATLPRSVSTASPHALRSKATEQRGVIAALEQMLEQAREDYQAASASDDANLVAAAKTDMTAIGTKLREARIELAEIDARLLAIDTDDTP